MHTRVCKPLSLCATFVLVRNSVNDCESVSSAAAVAQWACSVAGSKLLLLLLGQVVKELVACVPPYGGLLVDRRGGWSDVSSGHASEGSAADTAAAPRVLLIGLLSA